MYTHVLDVAPLFLSALVSAALAVTAWGRKNTRGNVYFSGAMVFLALYSVTVALELLTPDLRGKILWSKVQYLGNANLAPFWLLFSLKYANPEVHFAPRRLMLLWAVPVVVVLLVATNEWHGLAWPAVRLVPEGRGGMAFYEHGPAVWALAVYSYVLMVISTFALLTIAFRNVRFYRGQAAVLVTAALLPWLGNVMYMGRFEPFDRFDAAPLFFTVSGVLLGWGTLRFRLFRITPVAHAAVLSHMSEGLLILDSEGLILDMNPAAERLLRIPPGRVGTTLATAAPEAVLLAEHTAGTVTLQLPPEVNSGDGGARWLEAAISDLPCPARYTSCRLVLLRDITEQKNLAAQLLQAQKMESVGRLAGGVAHDFNNMLAVILGCTELVISQVDPDSPLCADLLEVEKAARRSAELTRQLLAFGRKQMVSPQVVDMAKVVMDGTNMLARLVGTQRELVTRNGAGIWPVKVDPAQVEQILANLVINARDAIPGGGTICVELENVELTEALCRTRPEARPGRFVCLTVSDTGQGMSESLLEHIFEPFFTTKGLGRGTGLGLATVYGIVKQNNGFIEVFSRVGVGSTFRVYLPRHKEVAPAWPNAPAPMLAGCGGA